MHELRIAEDLSAIVIETARRENLSKVTRVNVSFGQLTQIVHGIFEIAFAETVRNTIAENAEVKIEIVPVKMKCMNCGSDFQLKENRFSCIFCSSSEIGILNGNELFIKSIEGE
jgi:hydrogenase nickel incorporation protein HypA/HybF